MYDYLVDAMFLLIEHGGNEVGGQRKAVWTKGDSDNIGYSWRSSRTERCVYTKLFWQRGSRLYLRI